MGTTKVSNRSESPGRHGGNYKIDSLPERIVRRKRTKNGKTYEYSETVKESVRRKPVEFHKKEIGIHPSRKLSLEDKEAMRLQIDKDIEATKNEIKRVLERTGQIKYYTES